MSALIRKEIRLLLPFGGLAMLLAIVPAWIIAADFAPQMASASSMAESIFWGFGLGMILLGLAPFGQEFSLGTFSFLLSQPLERRRIWITKLVLIVTVAVIVLAAYIVANHLRLDSSLRTDLQTLREHPANLSSESLAVQETASKAWHAAEFSRCWKIGTMLFLIGISGGLWSTLLFRQTGAAFWFVILIPGGLYVAVEVACQSLSEQTLDLAMACVLILYSIVGLAWARRMFAQAQDSQWLGETVAVLSLSPARVRVEDDTVPRRKSVFRALVRKEIQSHQISILIAFGLLVLHSCTLVFRGFETLPGNSELRFAIGAVPFLWLFVPWLIGCVTVAEERKQGTMESQLCLPVKRRFQFGVKLTVALFLGILLGGLIPSLLEWIGTRVHISSEFIGTMSNVVYFDKTKFTQFMDVYGGRILMLVGAAFITTVSFFASTLSRNTLHALGGALVFGITFFALFQWVYFGSSYGGYFPWKGPLIMFIGVPVAVITVVWLSFYNYRRLHAGRNVWLRNVFILSATLAFTGIATALIDQRPWELVMPTEPLHGPRRLSGSVRPTLIAESGKVFALLPDGRLWVATQCRWQQIDKSEPQVQFQIDASRNPGIPVATKGIFVDGSNWVVLAANQYAGDVAALRSDGTLWNIFSRTNGSSLKNWDDWLAQEPKLKRVDSDNDWSTVASVGNGFFAVKTNGTLWGWGRNEEGQFGTNHPAFVDAPVQIGQDSDWETVFPGQFNSALFKKRDGSILTPGWTVTNHDLNRFRPDGNGADWMVVLAQNEIRVVIRRDGSLWARGSEKRLFGFNNPGWNTTELSRIGDDSDWVQVSGIPPDMVAIKGGRLLKNGRTLFATSLGQPSRYSDWLAVDAYWNQIVALAADGTLNMWYYSPPGDGLSQAMLAQTHRPFWTFNILTESKN